MPVRFLAGSGSLLSLGAFFFSPFASYLPCGKPGLLERKGDCMMLMTCPVWPHFARMCFLFFYLARCIQDPVIYINILCLTLNLVKRRCEHTDVEGYVCCVIECKEQLLLSVKSRLFSVSGIGKYTVTHNVRNGAEQRGIFTS